MEKIDCKNCTNKNACFTSQKQDVENGGTCQFFKPENARFDIKPDDQNNARGKNYEYIDKECIEAMITRYGEESVFDFLDKLNFVYQWERPATADKVNISAFIVKWQSNLISRKDGRQ